ncbi:MAG: hypothetical protein HUJ80_04485 [Firmicutes bacterium]|nr:hypothetical protein [Bacillota bacterium]
MAVEKKPVEKKIVNVNSQKVVPTKEERKASVLPKRIAAFVFWFLGIAMEVLAVLTLNGTLYLEKFSQMTMLLAFIVLDFIFVVVGSSFWKKANDVDPASKANKVKFFLWNQMGLIMSILAFFPLVILLLKDKDLDAKTKKIVSIAAAVALVACSALSIDYNPISEEEFQELETEYSDQDIYWTRWGKSYHTTSECPSLSRSKEVFQGTIDDALAANRNDPCDFCVLQE